MIFYINKNKILLQKQLIMKKIEIKKDDRTVFEKLLDEKICFAVVASRVFFKSKGAGRSTVDYGILIAVEDKSKVKRLGLNFYESRNKYHIAEYDMNGSESQEFKSKQKLFAKITHNEYGRTYELIGNSFKTKYDLLNVRNV